MVQKKGYNPSYINELSDMLLDGFYLRDGEIFDDAIARSAEAFSFGDSELAQRIYDAAWNGWFMYSSPVLSNAPEGSWTDKPSIEDWQNNTAVRHFTGPTDGPQAISCFATVVPDTIDGQMETMKELAALSVSGGGVGLHNNIRAVSKKAPGPIPFEKVIDAEIGYFKQSSVRRGATVYYLDVDHPDIIEHIKFRLPTGGDRKRKSDNITQFHSGVNVTDKFIQAVIDDATYDLRCPHSGDVHDTLRARHVWELILETRALTGEPYIIKIDTANRALPQAQKDLGLKIHSSNLCVHGDTRIMTKDGELPIKGLVGKEVEVWNGEEWSAVTPFQTGTDKSLLKVTARDAYDFTSEDGGVREVLCTPEHRFYIQTDGDVKVVEASELGIGDVLISWERNGREALDVIQSIEPHEGLHDTFCFTEPKRHMGVFNGMLLSNCSEIYLPTNEDRTFVCCLSSLNLSKYDEWKDTTLVADLTTYLDNVLQFFVETAPDALYKAKFSASRERALGIGAMGWHHYLQSKGIPFESGGFNSAIQHTHVMFKNIKEQAVQRSLELGTERGEAPDMAGTGRRNSHLLAIAPNSNSGIILGTSPSIEPDSGVAYIHTTRAGSLPVKNPVFKSLLDDRGFTNEEQEKIWTDILSNEGSVQHLDWLTEDEKKVFLTAYELDQHWVVEQADARQQYICQGQSLNLFFPAGVSKAYYNSVHLKALKAEYVKGLYYSRMRRSNKVDLRRLEVQTLRDWNTEDPDECVACAG